MKIEVVCEKLYFVALSSIHTDSGPHTIKIEVVDRLSICSSLSVSLTSVRKFDQLLQTIDSRIRRSGQLLLLRLQYDSKFLGVSG